jgi:transposase
MAVERSKCRESLMDLAKELDIRVELLYHWRKELLGKKEACFPGRGNARLPAEQAGIAWLKKQLKDAEPAREIYKYSFQPKKYRYQKG